MCGIIAAAEINRPVIESLLLGLSDLEYRGYDSAGYCLLEGRELKYQHAVGKVRRLQEIADNKSTSSVGIAHTRWATHGKPTLKNTHPFIIKEQIAIVHNGIIDNYQEIKSRIDVTLNSDTDSEVLAAYIYSLVNGGKTVLEALKNIVDTIKGSYAVAILYKPEDKIYFIKKNSPLIIGVSPDGMYLSSCIRAISRKAREVIYLNDCEYGFITREKYELFPVTRQPQPNNYSNTSSDKGNFEHYMLKEIHEQPVTISNNLLLQDGVLPIEPELSNLLPKCENIQFIACGTSYYSGMVAKYWIENLLSIPCQVEIASEFVTRNICLPKNTISINISQSGETADLIACLNKLKKENTNLVCSICLSNNDGSTLVRMSDFSLITKAGFEVGVASTKAFTAQLSMLIQFVITLGSMQNKLTADYISSFIDVYKKLPGSIEHIINDQGFKQFAQFLRASKSAIYLGKGILYPIALEGALKLKEISYIHATGFACGELKHGPIALIDDQIPVVICLSKYHFPEKTLACIEELKARNANLMVISDMELENLLYWKIPDLSADMSPILFTIPMQLLAYHVALLKGTDIDQPRNLAKSVTVE